MKTIIRRAYLICSTPDYTQEELDHITYVFEKFNNYLEWVIKQLLEEVKYNHHRTSHKVLQINEVNNDEKSHILLLPYFGPSGQKLIRSMKKAIFFFLNWDSLHAKLNSHYEASSYKKRSTKKITGYGKSV